MVINIARHVIYRVTNSFIEDFKDGIDARDDAPVFGLYDSLDRYSSPFTDLMKPEALEFLKSKNLDKMGLSAVFTQLRGPTVVAGSQYGGGTVDLKELTDIWMREFVSNGYSDPSSLFKKEYKFVPKHTWLALSELMSKRRQFFDPELNLNAEGQERLDDIEAELREHMETDFLFNYMPGAQPAD